jgi:adenylosuccinate lyase
MGLARVVRSMPSPSKMLALWHEREISHSSVEESLLGYTILLDYMFARITQMIEHLVIYPKRWKRI